MREFTFMEMPDRKQMPARLRNTGFLANLDNFDCGHIYTVAWVSSFVTASSWTSIVGWHIIRDKWFKSQPLNTRKEGREDQGFPNEAKNNIPSITRAMTRLSLFFFHDYYKFIITHYVLITHINSIILCHVIMLSFLPIDLVTIEPSISKSTITWTSPRTDHENRFVSLFSSIHANFLYHQGAVPSFQVSAHPALMHLELTPEALRTEHRDRFVPFFSSIWENLLYHRGLFPLITYCKCPLWVSASRAHIGRYCNPLRTRSSAHSHCSLLPFKAPIQVTDEYAYRA